MLSGRGVTFVHANMLCCVVLCCVVLCCVVLCCVRFYNILSMGDGVCLQIVLA